MENKQKDDDDHDKKELPKRGGCSGVTKAGHGNIQAATNMNQRQGKDQKNNLPWSDLWQELL